MKISHGLITVAATLVALVATAVPAHATDDTYTPIGTDITFVGSDITFTPSATGQGLTCSQFDLHGQVDDAGVSRGYGHPAVTFGGLTTSGCTSSFQMDGLWSFTVTGAEVGSVSPAQLSDVSLFVDASGCSFHVAGNITGDYDDATGEFATSSSSLVITDAPSGFVCGILGLAQGQSVEGGGSWQSVPPVIITSP
ncbi:hypothetical protein ASG90_03965 [Nocardioides sp. Soil797]|nr:hypothetical protein ASG90_03965 [Nocardioides sp. Soil797]